MNRNQKIAIWAGFALLLAVTLYVPYRLHPVPGVAPDLTYGFLFSEPNIVHRVNYGSPLEDGYQPYTNESSGTSVLDSSRLAIEILAISLLTAFAVFGLKEKSQKPQKPKIEL